MSDASTKQGKIISINTEARQKEGKKAYNETQTDQK